MGRGIPDFRMTGLANVSQCPITVDRGSPLRHALSCDLFFRCVSAVMYSFPKPFLAHGENLETCRGPCSFVHEAHTLQARADLSASGYQAAL